MHSAHLLKELILQTLFKRVTHVTQYFRSSFPSVSNFFRKQHPEITIHSRAYTNMAAWQTESPNVLPCQCLGGWGVPGDTRCPSKPLCHSPLDRGHKIQPWGVQSFSCHMFSLLPPTANAQVWGFPHLYSVIPVNP